MSYHVVEVFCYVWRQLTCEQFFSLSLASIKWAKVEVLVVMAAVSSLIFVSIFFAIGHSKICRTISYLKIALQLLVQAVVEAEEEVAVVVAMVRISELSSKLMMLCDHLTVFHLYPQSLRLSCSFPIRWRWRRWTRWRPR